MQNTKSKTKTFQVTYIHHTSQVLPRMPRIFVCEWCHNLRLKISWSNLPLESPEPESYLWGVGGGVLTELKLFESNFAPETKPVLRGGLTNFKNLSKSNVTWREGVCAHHYTKHHCITFVISVCK